MPFPVTQLLTLLARQVSSPVSVRIKEHAMTHPWFKRHVVMALGRAYHVVEIRAKLWVLALRQPAHVPPISDTSALDSGAKLLGEGILFGLGAIIILFEVNRQANNKNNKELEGTSRWIAMMMQLEELEREVTLQQQDIDRLLDELRRLAPRQSALLPAAAPRSPTHDTDGPN